MLPSCSRLASRACQRGHLSDMVSRHPAPHSVLHGRCHQPSRSSTLLHVNGLKRPRRAGTWREEAGPPPPPPVRVEKPPSSTDITRANMELARFNDLHFISAAFDLCTQLKANDVQPNRTTYDHLLSLCAHHLAPTEAWAILEDMISVGISPDRSAFHHVLRAMEAREIRGTWQLLQMMQESGIEPDARTYDILITRLVDSGNLELALQYVGILSDQGMTPLLNTAERVIRAACKHNLPRLALELAQSFEDASVRRLDGDIWMDCLIASAETHYVEGVQRAWHKCVHQLLIVPDEGCCIQVLNVAGRAGLPQLALDVIRTLQTMDTTWEEYHFAPLVEAFCKTGDLAQAFEVLGTMRSHNVAPNTGTTQPLYRAISRSIGTLDGAWEALDQLHTEAKPVDVTALNVLVRVAAKLDLQRAVGIYKAFSDFDATPTIDTFNYLLAGCIRMSHRELGDRLLKEMKEARIAPNLRTFERVILLCLKQPTYEDAFYYLEEMKGSGFKPQHNIYDAIVRKCVLMGDARYRLALDEMVSQGYEVNPRLKAFVEGGGETGPDESASADELDDLDPRVLVSKSK